MRGLHVTGAKWLKARGEVLVSRNFASWNQASQWLCKLDGLRLVAYTLDDESIGLIGLARH